MTAAKKNTSLMRNPASRVTLGRGKTAARKTAARKTTARRNPAKTVRSRRRYRRNSASGGMSVLTTFIGAGIGALGINLFDAAVNYAAPNTGAGIRTIVKGGIGAGLLFFGNKLPFGRSYAPMIGGAFVLATMLDVVQTNVMPPILNLLGIGAPQVVATKTVTNPATGEMGVVHELSNGHSVEYWNGAAIPAYTDAYAGQSQMAY